MGFKLYDHLDFTCSFLNLYFVCFSNFLFVIIVVLYPIHIRSDKKKIYILVLRNSETKKLKGYYMYLKKRVRICLNKLLHN